MFSRSRLKTYASLKDRKGREETGLFIAEGRKIVGEGLRSDCRCEAILVREGFFGKDEEADRLLSNRAFEMLDEADFRKVAGTEHPQGVIGVFAYDSLLIDEPSADNLIVLFDIADPRNAGTIIRSADWFGLRELIFGETCVDIFNDKTVRSTMGSIFHNRYLRSPRLLETLRELKPRYRIVTADIGGVDYRERTAVARAGGTRSAYIFSNEARGPSAEILGLTDEIVTIPGGGSAESLNVSCAAAIIMANIFPRTIL